MQKDYMTAQSAPDAGTDAREIEQIAAFWTKVWEDHRGNDTATLAVEATDEYRCIKSHLAAMPPGAKILDGGCGLGQWVAYLKHRGFDPLGIDISAPTVQRLKEMFPECAWSVEDINAMPFGDAELDAYISWGVFEHFEAGVAKPLTEAARVLKDNGFLFISVPQDSWRILLGRMRKPKFDRNQHDENYLFYQWRFTQKEIAFEVSRHGFDVLSITPIHQIEGARRMTQSWIGRYASTLPGEMMARGLKYILPGSMMGHMILVVARRTASRAADVASQTS
jgi:SAM-dependent methyltransferase